MSPPLNSATSTAAVRMPPIDRLTRLNGYSIRMADAPGVPCALCGKPTGRGPVGHYEGDPICDRCLEEGSRDLGAVLALIAAARLHVYLVRQQPDQRGPQLELLTAFLHSFEHLAERWGPARAVLESSGGRQPS